MSKSVPHLALYRVQRIYKVECDLAVAKCEDVDMQMQMQRCREDVNECLAFKSLYNFDIGKYY